MGIKRKDAIKDITKIKLNKGNVLVKVYEKQSNILIVKDLEEAAVPSEETLDYVEVKVVGPEVEDLEVGDIILDFSNGLGMMIGDQAYLIIHRLSINLAVTADNIDLENNLTS